MQGTSARYIKNFNKNDGTISYKTNMAGMKHYIGYYVKPHIDKADKLNLNVYKDWWYHGNHQTFNEQTLEYKKLKNIEATIGIGLPTTCGYNLNRKDITNIQAYFCEMDFVMTIADGSMHHFYEWSFPHAMAVPIAVDKKNKIQTININQKPSKTVYITAWGSSSRKREAKRKNSSESEV